MTNMSLRYRHRAALAALVVALISVACGGGGEEVTDDATGTPTPTDTPSGDDATASPTPTESATATATETPAASPTSGPTQEPAAPPEMTITSPAFANGGQIPIRYTCDGANQGCAPTMPPDACDQIDCNECIQCAQMPGSSCEPVLIDCSNSAECVDFANALNNCPP